VPVFRPRTRLVNFRLSEDEYQELKSTCSKSGARSVSDYARSAVLSGPSGKAPVPVMPVPASAEQPGCLPRWDRLEAVVTELEIRVRQLAERELIVAHG